MGTISGNILNGIKKTGGNDKYDYRFVLSEDLAEIKVQFWVSSSNEWRQHCTASRISPIPEQKSSSGYSILSSNGTFQLTPYQGYDFKSKSVIYYGNDSSVVDICFSFSYRATVLDYYTYLGASKINRFTAIPVDISAAKIDLWEDWSWEPAPGNYYIIRSRDGSYYFLKILSIENQDRIPARWVISFEWQEIALDG